MGDITGAWRRCAAVVYVGVGIAVMDDDSGDRRSGRQCAGQLYVDLWPFRCSCSGALGRRDRQFGYQPVPVPLSWRCGDAASALSPLSYLWPLVACRLASLPNDMAAGYADWFAYGV